MESSLREKRGPGRDKSGDRKRPRSVTLIAWFTIANGLLHAALFPWLLRTALAHKVLQVMRVPIGVALMWTLSSNAVHTLAGIGMLRGRNWGRLLYLGFAPVALLLIALVDGVHLYTVGALLLYGVFLVLLTRPSVSTFFSGRSPGLGRTSPG